MSNWLYKDAILLKKAGRNRSSLLLLFCLIDTLAKKKFPNKTSNKDRYISYLLEKLNSIGINELIRVEEKNKCIHISEIIYTYFRCNFVHEGDDRESDNYEIQIEYEKDKGFKFKYKYMLIDRSRKQIIVKSDWLIGILLNIAKNDPNLSI